MPKPRMATLGAAAGGALLALVGAAQSPVAGAAPVQLSIALTDNRVIVAPHSRVVYAATITNSGTEAVHGTLAFAAPDFVRYAHAPRHDRITKHEVRWRITVPGGQSVTERATVRVGTIPRSAARVTSLASFYLGAASAQPVIRTADADRIPGVKDPAPAPVIKPPAANPKIASSGGGIAAMGWSLVGAGALALVALGAGLMVRRRRAKRPVSLPEHATSELNQQVDHPLASVRARPRTDHRS